MTVGILALQGAFIEHEKMLSQIGVTSFEIRKKDDLHRHFDGLILPGGESTVMIKLLKELEMFEEVKSAIINGLPVFGTCAGMILLAKDVCNDKMNSLSTMDITVRRNAYGRQLGSFSTIAEMKGIGKIPMTFIRAPYIDSVKDNVEVLSIVDGHIVAAREDNQLATSFHPELTQDVSVHKYFVEMIRGTKSGRRSSV